MEDRNIILISVDALRPDHLSCYGYEKIETPAIDEIATKGAIFENCITASCLTPVSMASVLTAKYPNKHGLRNPFQKIQTTTIAEILKRKGYKTAAFTGINFLSRRCNFHKGFDLFKEPQEGWHQKKYKNEGGEELITNWGYWWVPEFLNWIDKNSANKFFIWGHYFECHVPAEEWLLKEGRIKPGELAENNYYDAKIKYMDESFFKPLIELLKKEDLFENTIIVVMSDHGETFDEHPCCGNYPQHRTMYNTDLRSTLIIKGDFASGSSMKTQVRTIDIAPTIIGPIFNEKIPGIDGQSLINFEGKDRIAYSEEIYEQRGAGSLQAIQDGRFKLMRNNTTKEEEFYDIVADHLEQSNLIDEKREDERVKLFRKELDRLMVSEMKGEEVSGDDEEIIRKKLKSLGYIK